MNIIQLSGSIDFSGDEVAFAIVNLDNNNLVVKRYKIFNGRESSGISLWILDILKELNYSLDNIVEWTVGSGPGNFSGLRIMSALVSGFLLNKDNIKRRAVPSIFAIAYSFVEDNSSVKVLYNARRNEIAVYNVQKNNGVFILDKTPVFLDIENVSFEENQKYIAMESEKEAIIKICGSEFSDKVSYLEHFPIQYLSNINKESMESILDLIYLRLPVN